MSLSRPSLAMLNPILDSSVFIPSVVPRKHLDSWHVVWVIEDLIFFIKKSDGLLGSLILINAGLNLLKESCFLLNIMMLSYHIGVPGW